MLDCTSLLKICKEKCPDLYDESSDTLDTAIRCIECPVTEIMMHILFKESQEPTWIFNNHLN